MSWYASPISLAFILSAVLLVFLAQNLLRFSDQIGYSPIILLVGNGIWLCAYGIALGIYTFDLRILFAKIQYIGIALTMIGLIGFSLEFCGYGKWFDKKRSILFSIIPIASTLLAFTNELHHTIWRHIQIEIVDGLSILQIEYGWFFYVYLLFNYTLVVTSLGLIFLRGRGHNKLIKRQSMLILFGILLPYTGNIAYILGMNQPMNTYVIVIGYVLSSLIFTWGLTSQRWLGVPSQQRMFVGELLLDAVFVIDSKERLIDINQHAAKLLDVKPKDVIGTEIGELFSRTSALSSLLLNKTVGVYDIEIGPKISDARHQSTNYGKKKNFQAHILDTALKPFQEPGRLIVLRESTELVTASESLIKANQELTLAMQSIEMDQQKIVEQQRLLSAAEERNKVGHELHEGLGQLFSTMSVNVQESVKYLQSNQPNQAYIVLDRLLYLVNQGHETIRFFIQGLRPPTEQLLLIDSIHGLVEKFETDTGIPVYLSLPDTLNSIVGHHQSEFIVLYVLREAFANIRKHSNATKVEINLSVGDGVYFDIKDDGQGFSPKTTTIPNDHYGIRMMREKVNSVGGELRIETNLGKGTRIHLWIPIPSQELNEESDATNDLSNSKKLRIALVDDHVIFLEGLKTLLQSHGLNVVGCGKDANEAEKLVSTLHPDILLLDVNLAATNGVDAVPKLVELHPNLKVILLSAQQDPYILLEAIENGASGYVLKNISVKDLIHVLASVANGKPAISRSIGLDLIKNLGQSKNDVSLQKFDSIELTYRQKEILKAFADGMVYKKIATLIGTSERTVKRDLARSMQLLNVKDRHELLNLIKGDEQ